MTEETSSTSSTYDSLQPSKRKIQLCRSWVQIGYCPYGKNCFFAHGYQQLILNQPILKSKVCRNYKLKNYCRYGYRCNFIHQKNCNNNLSNIVNNYPQLISISLTPKSISKNFII